MDPVMVQVIITALAATVSTLAVTIYKMLTARIARLEADAEKARMSQEAVTKTLQAVIDVGMERLRDQGPSERRT